MDFNKIINIRIRLSNNSSPGGRTGKYIRRPTTEGIVDVSNYGKRIRSLTDIVYASMTGFGGTDVKNLCMRYAMISSSKSTTDLVDLELAPLVALSISRMIHEGIRAPMLRYLRDLYINTYSTSILSMLVPNTLRHVTVAYPDDAFAAYLQEHQSESLSSLTIYNAFGPSSDNISRLKIHTLQMSQDDRTLLNTPATVRTLHINDLEDINMIDRLTFVETLIIDNADEYSVDRLRELFRGNLRKLVMPMKDEVANELRKLYPHVEITIAVRGVDYMAPKYKPL